MWRPQTLATSIWWGCIFDLWCPDPTLIPHAQMTSAMCGPISIACILSRQNCWHPKEWARRSTLRRSKATLDQKCTEDFVYALTAYLVLLCACKSLCCELLFRLILSTEPQLLNSGVVTTPLPKLYSPFSIRSICYLFPALFIQPCQIHAESVIQQMSIRIFW